MAGVALTSVLACGGPSGTSDDSGAPVEAAIDASAEAASDAGVYPAFTPEMPKVVNAGGAILASPKIVTVTWNDDPNQALLDSFGDAIAQSAYWKATTNEYGVGPATSEHVHIGATAPKTMTDDALVSMIADDVGAAPASGWPANDANTVYVVYVPEAMELTSSGANDCNNEDGYHDETQTSSIAHIVYAVVNEGCHDTQDVVSFTTETASHEMVESATDPHAETDLAWAGFDQDHYAWERWNDKQDELADACEYFAEANDDEPMPLGWLQRSWSNAGAAAGHDPCVPAPDGAYYNATPLGLDAISVAKKSGSIATKGYSIAVGAKRTIQIGLYSDAPHDPWTVNVVEGDGLTTPTTPHLTVAQSVTSGRNGDVLDVDLTAGSASASGVLVTIVSTAPGEPTHYMPFLVATE